ncbi:MAG: hypothetical protein NT038_03600 [Euryarchaeota archaeon]|nr:hypothetical protein [Euryarchaeota archaeon]
MEFVPVRGEQQMQMQVSCPTCTAITVIKKGKQTTKNNVIQRYQCTLCNTTFISRGFPHKTYRAQVIIDALITYNRGYTLKETQTIINKKYKTHTSTSTIQRWIHEQSDTCTYSRLRPVLSNTYSPESIIVSKHFTYNGLAYNFKYHRGKNEILGSLFPTLATYIQRFENGCPSFFSEIEHRCSTQKLPITIQKKEDTNIVNKLTALALSSSHTPAARHAHVETFLLLNDHATVAVEVPVWFWEKQPGFGIAGHIDIIQIRDGCVYILDYKPDAAKQNNQTVASQLYLYARGLSFRTNIPLEQMRCAYFDEKTYLEFSPEEAIVSYPQKTTGYSNKNNDTTGMK